MNRQPDLPEARTRSQMAMATMTLAYFFLLWWYSTPYWTLIQLGMVPPLSVMLGLAGVAALSIGVLRHVVNARTGQYFFLFAAIALGAAGWLIGFRDYLIGKKLLGVFLAGLVLAASGAVLALSANKTIAIPSKKR